jgi:hypothetical protein
MKVTNKHGVPDTLYALANRQFYSKGKSDYSVTEIMSPPRIQRLRARHQNELESDVADMLWSLLGSALHVVAERSEVPGHVNEERLYIDVDGVTLSGQIDLQKIDGKFVEIIDYKFTSAWALRQDKIEWAQQQNIYGWLVHKTKGLEVRKLSICALVRDWSRREAQRNPDYPQAPIQMVDIPVWDMAFTEVYVNDRIRKHRDAKVAADWEDELPTCDEEERWVRETKYAIMKKDRKSAVKLFDAVTEAEALLATLDDKHYIEVRKGEPIRCVNNFCGVNQWCSQFKQYQQEQENERV